MRVIKEHPGSNLKNCFCRLKFQCHWVSQTICFNMPILCIRNVLIILTWHTKHSQCWFGAQFPHKDVTTGISAVFAGSVMTSYSIARSRHFMQLQRIFFFFFAFFAKLLNVSWKFEKWSCKHGKWCKSAVKHKFRLNIDTFFGKTSS